MGPQEQPQVAKAETQDTGGCGVRQCSNNSDTAAVQRKRARDLQDAWKEGERKKICSVSKAELTKPSRPVAS